MRLERIVQIKRIITAAAAIAAVRKPLFLSAVLWKREASRPVTAVIMAIFAAREHHWAATFPIMYFLLSRTVPISLLLIIIMSYHAFPFFFVLLTKVSMD